MVELIIRQETLRFRRMVDANLLEIRLNTFGKIMNKPNKQNNTFLKFICPDNMETLRASGEEP